VGFHLNQANILLHQISIGDSILAFTRKLDGRYALAAELVVSAKTMNPRRFRYGPYRVWGDGNDPIISKLTSNPTFLC
jgi:hypothetical protein